MVKFKVGDKVRFIGLNGGSFTHGNTYTVREYPTMFGAVGVTLDDRGSTTNGLPERFFELVTTLKDLREKALEALDKGLLYTVELRGGDIPFIRLQVEPGNFNRYYEDTVQQGLDYLESLNTESFVIESENDIKRVIEGAEIFLANGVQITASKRTYSQSCIIYHKDETRPCERLWIESLKGATVTQKPI